MLIAPARRSSVTTLSSQLGTLSANAVEPSRAGTPATAVRSLIAVGTPSSGGQPVRVVGPASRRSAASASASARSAVTVTNAPTPVVERLDAGEGVLDRLARTDLPRADGGGELQRGQVVELAHPAGSAHSAAAQSGCCGRGSAATPGRAWPSPGRPRRSAVAGAAGRTAATRARRAAGRPCGGCTARRPRRRWSRRAGRRASAAGRGRWCRPSSRSRRTRGASRSSTARRVSGISCRYGTRT